MSRAWIQEGSYLHFAFGGLCLCKTILLDHAVKRKPLFNFLNALFWLFLNWWQWAGSPVGCASTTFSQGSTGAGNWIEITEFSHTHVGKFSLWKSRVGVCTYQFFWLSDSQKRKPNKKPGRRTKFNLGKLLSQQKFQAPPTKRVGIKLVPNYWRFGCIIPILNAKRVCPIRIRFREMGVGIGWVSSCQGPRRETVQMGEVSAEW